MEWEPSRELSTSLNPCTSKDYVFPIYDSILFKNSTTSTTPNESVLNKFLKLEKFYLINCSYFQNVQTEVNVRMRSVVTQWMLEVCDEERCSSEVFPLAVSYLDRFLSIESIHKSQLQALATACLFLASKTKLPRHFDGARLCRRQGDEDEEEEL